MQLFLRGPGPESHIVPVTISPNSSLQALIDLSLSTLRCGETLGFEPSRHGARFGCSTNSFRVLHGGRQLFPFASSRHRLSSVASLTIRPYDTLDVTVPLRGGGGDGGATGAESRDCYLQMYAGRRPDKVDPRDTRVASWTHCQLSGEPLTPPCVVDLLGNVFNKEAVVRALVEKSIPVALKHIKGLRDVVGIQLTEIPGLDKKAHVRFLCPITQQEFSGSFKFVALRPCGHVLSARALKELPSPTCLVCHAKFLETDRIPINGTEEEVEVLRTRMEEEQASRRAGKKKKGAPPHSQVDVAVAGNGLKGAAVEDVDGVAVVDVRARSLEKKGIAAGVTATGSLSPEDKAIDAAGLVDKRGVKRKGAEGPTAGMKNTSEGSVNKSRPKGSDLVQVKQHFKAVDKLPAGASKDVYASIFTSSRKEDLKETYSCRSLPLGRN